MGGCRGDAPEQVRSTCAILQRYYVQDHVLITCLSRVNTPFGRFYLLIPLPKSSDLGFDLLLLLSQRSVILEQNWQ